LYFYSNLKSLKTEIENLSSKLNQLLLELNKKNLDEKIDKKANLSENPHIWSSSSLNMITKMYSKSDNKDGLPDRVFFRRNSLLTEMLKISHVKTIRNIFISIMIILALQVASNDINEKGVYVNKQNIAF
jgi:hypothetical protein